ncbi:MAG: hypothetical protein EOO39_27040, partial [Cytophagaceae bacterium]
MAPIIAISTPTAGYSAQSSITLTGTCETGIYVVASGTGLLSSYSSIICSGGIYSQPVYFSDNDGAKSVTVTQTDSAGNSTSVNRSFARDTTAPALTQTAKFSPHSNSANSASFGGACESGSPVVVSGADASSVTCTSNAWSYTTPLQTTDASYVYTFKQTDTAGNQALISATWIRDTVAPALALTSAASYVTSGNSVTFTGTCETGLSIAVSNAEISAVSCVGGTWAFSTDKSSDSNYSYTFTETDLAGNASSVTGTWGRSTTGPTITIAQASPQITNGNSLLITGKCSGGTAGSSGVITITGAFSGAITCPSTNSTPAGWSYTATKSSDAAYAYHFAITDNFTTPRTSAADFTWIHDATAPLITPGSFVLNGGIASTAVSYNPASFQATDNLSTVSKFCLKSGSIAPDSTDSCWASLSTTGAIPANSVAVSNFPFNIGILPQAYFIYLWVMDGAGNISANAGSVGNDAATITLSPIPPPDVNTVLVSNSDEMNGLGSERILPAGTDAYIRWTASGPNFTAAPVGLYFTTDDKTWTTITTGLNNGINN